MALYQAVISTQMPIGFGGSQGETVMDYVSTGCDRTNPAYKSGYINNGLVAYLWRDTGKWRFIIGSGQTGVGGDTHTCLIFDGTIAKATCDDNSFTINNNFSAYGQCSARPSSNICPILVSSYVCAASMGYGGSATFTKNGC